MSDVEISQLPEFQLAVQKFLANENRKRERLPITKRWDCTFWIRIEVAEFRKEMIKSE